MKPLLRENLMELIDHTGDVCISLYLSTRLEQQQNLVVLRNMINEAREQIKQFVPFMGQPDIEKLLQPAVQLEGAADFGQHLGEGVAIFLGTDFSRVYRLPLAVTPLVMVNGRFQIRPLLPFVAENGRFYLLALSQNQVRFFQATQYGMHEIELPDIPTSLDEVLVYDQPEKQLQFHGAAGSSSGLGGRASVFYSVDIPTNYKKESLLRYCQQVNDGLRHILHDEASPLVVACVGYLFSLYQQANSYPHLFPTCIEGSPDRTGEKALHKKGWALVQPLFQKAQQEALTRFWNGLNRSRAATHVAHIVAAAFEGRVETLFTAVTGQQWGAFNQHTNQVYLHEYGVPHDQELLNLATIFTLNHGGQVYALPPDDLGENIKLAAIYRY